MKKTEKMQKNEEFQLKKNSAFLKEKNESLMHETSKNYQSVERNNSEEQDVEKLQMQIVAFEKTIKE